jgi:AraC-like DNA-binding protein
VGDDYSLAHYTQAEKTIFLLGNHKKMNEIRERYVNPFTDSNRFAARFRKLFGEEPKKELQSYEDSLKYYRDLKNSLDTAFEEGKMEGEVSKAIEVIKKGYSEGFSVEMLSKLTGMSVSEVSRVLNEN